MLFQSDFRMLFGMLLGNVLGVCDLYDLFLHFGHFSV